jgi:hypothetical protein
VVEGPSRVTSPTAASSGACQLSFRMTPRMTPDGLATTTCDIVVNVIESELFEPPRGSCAHASNGVVAIHHDWVVPREPRHRTRVHLPKPESHGAGDSQPLVFLG